ncbi:hypothetical protein K1719_013285 [Acacia pycnantha]|nr:hypothetical protein K1719_013285 [Acacia pycnantha]
MFMEDNGFKSGYANRLEELILEEIKGNPHIDEYIKVHKRAETYRNKCLPHFQDMCFVWSKDRAVGDYCKSPKGMVEEILEEEEEEEVIPESPIHVQATQSSTSHLLWKQLKWNQKSKKDNAPRCKCGRPSVVYTSKTQRNPNRAFFGCHNFKEKLPYCDFFKWVDDSGNDSMELEDSTVIVVVGAICIYVGGRLE